VKPFIFIETPGRRAAACAALLCVATTAVVPGRALAQDAYPNRPITLVVPFPTGSGTDLSARLLAKDMAESLGQSVVVENRPGANGSLGAQAVMRAKPDGHTLLIGAAATNASNYAFFPGKLGYTPASFDIVGGLGIVPLSMVVAPGAPWKTLAELIADAKKNPGKLACGSGTTTAQVACEMFMLRAGVSVLNVPYKGTPPAMNDLAGGHVHFVFADGSSATPLVEQKRLRVLATAASKRAPYWPDVPTFAELGMPDLEISAWSAVFAPAGTPVSVQQQLNAVIRRSTESPESVASRQRSGSLPMPYTLEEARRFVAAEIERWARFVKESGVKLE
jgi:tripartite-type tricarboxylate transporter receptor subunit TctC